MPRALVHPRLIDRLASSGVFPSRATIEANTPTRSASGHPTPAWTAVAGLTGIPAAVSPFHFARQGEQRRSELTIVEGTHRIGLAGAFPAITAKHRVVISGQHAGVYDITRPQTDGQTGMTVLEARQVEPVAAAGV